jgi:hypothetical protein
VTYSDIPRLATMALVWLVLLIWHLLASSSGYLTFIGVVSLFTLVLVLSTSENALARRQAFIDACLEPEGRRDRLTGLRYPLIAIEAGKSLLLATLLAISALSYAPRQWSLMFAAVLLAGLLLPRFYGAFAGHVRERYRYARARRWTLWICTLLLWLEGLIVLFFSDGQNVMGLRWQEVVVHAGREPHLRCVLVAQATAVLSAVDSLGPWSVQNLGRSLADLPQALVAGFSLLAAVGLDFLRAYSFGLALIGAVARPQRFWDPQRGAETPTGVGPSPDMLGPTIQTQRCDAPAAPEISG